MEFKIITEETQQICKPSSYCKIQVINACYNFFQTYSQGEEEKKEAAGNADSDEEREGERRANPLSRIRHAALE